MPERTELSVALRLHYRILLVLVQAAVPALAWMLGRSHGAAGVAAVIIAIAAWLCLASRTWRESAALTSGALEIRNIFRTIRLDVTSVRGVWFSRGALRITVAEGGVRTGRHSGGRQYQAAAVRLGAAHWSGRRTRADEFADALAAAAGLPPLARRVRSASGRQVRAGLAAGAALTVLGVGVEALAQVAGGATIVRMLGGGVLYAAGLMLYPVTMVAMDRFFGRRRAAVAALASAEELGR
jgi:hypothetical protein